MSDFMKRLAGQLGMCTVTAGIPMFAILSTMHWYSPGQQIPMFFIYQLMSILTLLLVGGILSHWWRPETRERFVEPWLFRSEARRFRTGEEIAAWNGVIDHVSDDGIYATFDVHGTSFVELMLDRSLLPHGDVNSAVRYTIIKKHDGDLDHRLELL